MAIKAHRILRNLLVGSLTTYAFCLQYGWVGLPFDIGISREFGFWLIYAGPTLLCIGIVVLGLVILCNVSVKRTAVPIEGTEAPAKHIGTAIANSLTRYKFKHPFTSQHNTLTLSLADFESALLQKLPEEAYTRST